ncbi:MAG: hypothetical protein JXA42_10350 [Anaerolineales bacterium]|nr:hypothetical protein [Anaerolineales bacterium]
MATSRQARSKRLFGNHEYGYANHKHIAKEMEWFSKILRRGVGFVMDVPHRAIDVTVSEILDIVRVRPGK